MFYSLLYLLDPLLFVDHLEIQVPSFVPQPLLVTVKRMCITGGRHQVRDTFPVFYVVRNGKFSSFLSPT